MRAPVYFGHILIGHCDLPDPTDAANSFGQWTDWASAKPYLNWIRTWTNEDGTGRVMISNRSMIEMLDGYEPAGENDD